MALNVAIGFDGNDGPRCSSDGTRQDTGGRSKATSKFHDNVTLVHKGFGRHPFVPFNLTNEFTAGSLVTIAVALAVSSKKLFSKRFTGIREESSPMTSGNVLDAAAVVEDAARS
jgi:hypothetical protein